MKIGTKLIGTILAVGLGLAGIANAKDWKKIRIGVEGAYPPFSEMGTDGKLVGFDIDIANALCQEMKAKCKLVAQDWDGLIPALNARKFDAIIASMSITEERKRKVAFSQKYYQTPARFVRKTGDAYDPNQPKTLKGQKVGVQRGTTHERFIKETFGELLDVKTYATQDEAYLDMVAGRIQLLIADSVAIHTGFLKTTRGSQYEFVGPEYTDAKFFGEGNGVAMRKSDGELQKKFNNAILAIRKNGVYESIRKKYFAFDIYGQELPTH